MATDPASLSDVRAILRTPGPRRIGLLRGMLESVAGAIAVLQPDVAESAIGVALVAVSLLELVGRRDVPAAGRIDYRRIRIVIGLLAGLALILAQSSGGNITDRVVLLAVVLLGAVDVVAGLRSRDRSGRATRLSRGVLFVALAIVLYLIPTVAWNAMLLVGGLALLAGGLLTIGAALRTSSVLVDSLDGSVGMLGSLGTWMRQRDIGEERRAEILDAYTYDPPVADKLTRFTILLGLAGTISAVGLIADSVATIIGAMIIAPLMVPIVGIALGIVTGTPQRAMRSLLVTIFGIVFTILLAVAIGSWLATPTLTMTPQIVARTAPTILDLVIALASGAAGAYGVSNRKVSDALAGVAISISLVPPLSTVGLLLGQGDFNGASGAMLLFMTNFVSIVLSASVVFVLVGIAPIGQLVGRDSQTRAWLITFAAGALVLLVPLAVAFQTTYAESSDEIAAGQAVEAWLPPGEGYQIMSVRVHGDTVEVQLAGPLDPTGLKALDADVDAALGRNVATQVRVFAAVTYPVNVAP